MILDNSLVIGCGQGGGGIAYSGRQFFKRTIFLNTNANDMAFIPGTLHSENPHGTKYVLALSSGTGKDPAQGARALQQEAEQVEAWIAHHAKNVKFILIVVSLGGGSGTGTCRGVLDIALKMGKPVGVVCSLPEDRQDALSYKNAIEVFRDLYAYALKGKIAPLIPMRNQLLIDAVQASYADRWKKVNKLIWNVFSTLDGLSMQAPSAGHDSIIDPMDLARVWVSGSGCATVAAFPLMPERGEDPDEVIRAGLAQPVFFDGFDFGSAQILAYAVQAPPRLYGLQGFTHLLDALDAQMKALAPMTFRGVYATPPIMEGDLEVVDQGHVGRVYVLLNGLRIPQTWVNKMISEVSDGMAALKKKQARIGQGIAIDIEAEDDPFANKGFDKVKGL